MKNLFGHGTSILSGSLVLLACMTSCSSGSSTITNCTNPVACDADGGADTGVDDSSSGDVVDGSPDVVTITCPTGKGPSMAVLAAPNGSAFCIDTTEVTVEQYAAFLAASGGNTSGQPAGCSWNTSFSPDTMNAGCTAATNDVAQHPRDPVRCVDWCDAQAFCTWAGKHLCGGFNRSIISPGEAPDPTKAEWSSACTSQGKYDYDYGSSYRSAACADRSYANGTGPFAVGTATQCHSPDAPYSVVVDLVGNVAEWLDACDFTNGTGDECPTGGWDFQTQGACKFQDQPFNTFRGDVAPTIGFRCCAD